MRSIGKANSVVAAVHTQEAFDVLFSELFNPDRKVVMRAADAIEKISSNQFAWLKKHKKEVLLLCRAATAIELKWHLALIVSRITLTEAEFGKTWTLLTNWASDRKESKIVRANAIQGLYNLLKQKPGFTRNFNELLSDIEKENLASLNARIKKLRSAGH